jgi:hypothetical protein
MAVINHSHEPLALSHVSTPADVMLLPRFRGVILRLVRRRALAFAVGLALVLPAAWVEFSGQFDAWWIEGLALVMGATGVAILWTGLTGAAPDWIDDDGHG